jgi:hypothetical protein
MSRRKRARRTLAMHPAFALESAVAVRQQLAARDVVADVIHQRTFHAGNHFLERLEHERVDEQMVHGREVRAERHVIEIRVSLGRAERRIDEFLVVAGQRDVPLRELALQVVELAGRQRVTEPARTAVREEAHPTVAQPNTSPAAARARSLSAMLHHFALAEMIAAAIRAELRDLFDEVREAIRAQPIKSRRERIARFVMADVHRVFATLRPFERDAERVQHFADAPSVTTFTPSIFADLAGFARGTLAATRTGRRAFEDGVDETRDGPSCPPLDLRAGRVAGSSSSI